QAVEIAGVIPIPVHLEVDASAVFGEVETGGSVRQRGVLLTGRYHKPMALEEVDEVVLQRTLRRALPGTPGPYQFAQERRTFASVAGPFQESLQRPETRQPADQSIIQRACNEMGRDRRQMQEGE